MSARSVSDPHSIDENSLKRMMKALDRKPERILLFICSAFEVILASLTLFVFSNQYRNKGYALMQSKKMLRRGFGTVDNITMVIQIYGFVLIGIAIVTFIIAYRYVRTATVSRGAMGWMWFCLIFALLTRDFIGIALFSIALAIYCGRNKAIRAYQYALAHPHSR
jgi:hypothetical protein